MSKKNPPIFLSLVNQAELLFKLEQLSTHIFLLRQLNTDESFLRDLLEIVDSYITKITNTHNFVEQFEFSFFERWLNGSPLGYRCWISHANRRLS